MASEYESAGAIAIRPRLILRRNEYGAYVLTQLPLLDHLKPNEVVIQASEVFDLIQALRKLSSE